MTDTSDKASNPAKVADLLLTKAKSANNSIASDLSIDETVLLVESGFEIAGLVTGVSYYHVGYTGVYSLSQNMEIDQISKALHAARNSAVYQLAAKGKSIGGVGVVGVKIEMSPSHRGLVEFSATGTAIRPVSKGDSKREISANLASVLSHVSPSSFFTSDLSGKDFLLLARAGYLPLGLVFGACVYHVGRQAFSNWISNQQANVELEIYTAALYDARELAMSRMQADAEMLKADGVVGTTIKESSHTWGSHIIEFLAMGTAVRLVSNQHHLSNPSVTVPLDDPVVKTQPGSILGE